MGKGGLYLQKSINQAYRVNRGSKANRADRFVFVLTSLGYDYI